MAASFQAEKTFTLTLNGPGEFVVTADDGIRKISVAALNSTVNGSVEMINPTSIGTHVSTGIPVIQGVPITITPAKEDGILSGFKIAVAGGGILAIIAQI